LPDVLTFQRWFNALMHWYLVAPSTTVMQRKIPGFSQSIDAAPNLGFPGDKNPGLFSCSTVGDFRLVVSPGPRTCRPHWYKPVPLRPRFRHGPRHARGAAALIDIPSFTTTSAVSRNRRHAR
jgi:hypothetical protein